MTSPELTLLDGGMGRELERMGAPFRQPEWSALALMDAPHKVLEAHRAFIAAGADVITTNAYALVPFHIGRIPWIREGRPLMNLAGDLAREAADESERDVKVAGCIPPLFGSYQPDNFDAARAPSLLRPLVEEQGKFVDLWLIETLCSLQEIEVMGDLFAAAKKPVWISLSLTDNQDSDAPATLRSGENVEDAVHLLLKQNFAAAILFNCSQPEEMLRALKMCQNLVSDQDIQCGAYANTFPPIEEQSLANDEISPLRESLTPARYLEFAEEWRGLGASIIGGCCGIGPEHIAALKDGLA